MDRGTLKRALHDPQSWQRCPVTWDQTIAAARDNGGFEPARRSEWLAGWRAPRLIGDAVVALTSRRMLGRVAGRLSIAWLDYWCACFLAPWPYDGARAAASDLTLPRNFGFACGFWGSHDPRVAGDTTEEVVLPELAAIIAWQVGADDFGHDVLAHPDAPESVRAAVKRSPLWRQILADHGGSTWLDRRIVDRAKVKPRPSRANDLVQRYAELAGAYGVQVAYDTVLAEEAQRQAADVAVIREHPDKMNRMRALTRQRVRNTLMRAARREVAPPLPPSTSAAWWPPRP